MPRSLTPDGTAENRDDGSAMHCRCGAQRRVGISGSVVILLLLSLPAAAEEPDAAAILQGQSRPKTIAADFVQTRKIPELDMDIRITGSMVCELDKRLRWQVDSPVRSVTVIDREKLTHYDGETKNLAVIKQETLPWLKALRDSLDDWLSGDRKRLEQRFLLSVPRPGTLRLEPRDAVQKKLYRSVEIELAGDKRSIAKIIISESGGNLLEIAFRNVRNDPVPSPDTWVMPPR